ncbi:cytochrome b/b6 domain-containing protein [Labilithrix luteola]|nr:cytochrome b/b6 domain-containing protein [Labilithrix luteola]
MTRRREQRDRARRAQPWIVRLTHWGNVVFLPVMAGSGLQILMAFPYFGPRGQMYTWFPIQNWTAPEWMRIGGWLAGARHVHFAFAWALVANALLYLVYVFASGEWRRRFFLPRRDAKQAVGTFAHYLRLRRDAPAQGFYNGLQRLAYTTAIVLGVVEVLSGLAMWKPVQLSYVAALFGGYDGARVVHFVGLVALALFVIMHVVLVAFHPRTLPPMITGGPVGQ